MKFEQWLKKVGLKKDEMSADELKAAETTFDALLASGALDPDDTGDIAASEDDEQIDDEVDDELAASDEGAKPKKKKRVAAGADGEGAVDARRGTGEHQ